MAHNSASPNMNDDRSSSSTRNLTSEVSSNALNSSAEHSSRVLQSDTLVEEDPFADPFVEGTTAYDYSPIPSPVSSAHPFDPNPDRMVIGTEDSSFSPFSIPGLDLIWEATELGSSSTVPPPDYLDSRLVPLPDSPPTITPLPLQDVVAGPEVDTTDIKDLDPITVPLPASASSVSSLSGFAVLDSNDSVISDLPSRNPSRPGLHIPDEGRESVESINRVSRWLDFAYTLPPPYYSRQGSQRSSSAGSTAIASSSHAPSFPPPPQASPTSSSPPWSPPRPSNPAPASVPREFPRPTISHANFSRPRPSPQSPVLHHPVPHRIARIGEWEAAAKARHPNRLAQVSGPGPYRAGSVVSLRHLRSGGSIRAPLEDDEESLLSPPVSTRREQWTGRVERVGPSFGERLRVFLLQITFVVLIMAVISLSVAVYLLASAPRLPSSPPGKQGK